MEFGRSLVALENISIQISIPKSQTKIHSIFPQKSHSNSRHSTFSSELSVSFSTLKMFLENSHFQSRLSVYMLSQKSQKPKLENLRKKCAILQRFSRVSPRPRNGRGLTKNSLSRLVLNLEKQGSKVSSFLNG